MSERFLYHRTHFPMILKKNPAPQDSPPVAGRFGDIIPFHRSAILAERFCFIGRNFL